MSLLSRHEVHGIHWHALALVGGFSFVSNLILLALPIFTLQVYDRVLISRSTDTLVILAIGIVIALSVMSVFDVLRGHLMSRLADHVDRRLGPQLMEATLASAARTGQRSSQPLRDLAMVRNSLMSPAAMTSFDLPWALFFLVIVYLMHPWLGHVLLVSGVVLLGLAFASERTTSPLLLKSGQEGIAAQRRADSAAAHAGAIEAMGMREAMLRHWNEKNRASAVLLARANDRSSIISATAKWARLVLNVVLTATGAYLVIGEQITIGALIAANILSARALAPLESLLASWKSLVAAREALDRIEECLGREKGQVATMTLPEPAGRLTLEQLFYVPPRSDKPTIKGIAMTLAPGTVLGLIGPSASGKSTLARLMVGVWQPHSGAVRLDGADVAHWNRAEGGRHIGYLPQEVELFEGNVRDNIARFQPAGDREVIEAATMAGAHEMILRLPQGYDTPVGDGGAVLSGGQRQQIALARALFRKPRLLVLDEPNASLDAAGEVALVRAIAQAKAAGSTVVVIAHRPSVLAGADQLAVMNNGQLEAFGKYAEMIRKYAPGSRPVPVGGDLRAAG